MLEALPSWFSIFERDGKRDIPLFRLKQPKWENMKPMIRQTGFIWLLVLKNLKCFQIYGMSGTRVKCILWKYDTLYKKIGESL